jgi:hypothetical protein
MARCSSERGMSGKTPSCVGAKSRGRRRVQDRKLPRWSWHSDHQVTPGAAFDPDSGPATQQGAVPKALLSPSGDTAQYAQNLKEDSEALSGAFSGRGRRFDQCPVSQYLTTESWPDLGCSRTLFVADLAPLQGKLRTLRTSSLAFDRTPRPGRSRFLSYATPRRQVVAGLLRVWSCSTGLGGAKCNGRHADLINKIKGPRINFQTTNQEVGSSNLSGRANSSRSIPDTWVTDYSGDMGKAASMDHRNTRTKHMRGCLPLKSFSGSCV